ncbi:hypothetical protein [Sphingobium sp. B2]|nr:hypothetical protein [Sphingobium sp. B2]
MCIRDRSTGSSQSARASTRDVYKRQINGIKPVRTRKHKRCV